MCSTGAAVHSDLLAADADEDLPTPAQFPSLTDVEEETLDDVTAEG